MVIVKLQCDNKRGDVEHHGEAPDEGGDAAENKDESSKAAATHLSSKISQPRSFNQESYSHFHLSLLILQQSTCQPFTAASGALSIYSQFFHPLFLDTTSPHHSV